eukprot:scaffold69292_cov54-Phaeocystis_antarctica.AAC.1
MRETGQLVCLRAFQLDFTAGDKSSPHAHRPPPSGTTPGRPPPAALVGTKPVWKVPRVIGKSPRTHWGQLGSPSRMAPPPPPYPPPQPPQRSKSLGSGPVYNAVAIMASRTRPRVRGDLIVVAVVVVVVVVALTLTLTLTL